MTTAELIERIARETGIGIGPISAVLHTSSRVMKETLKRGESVTLLNFGVFYVVKLQGKELFGRKVGPRKKIRFRTSRRNGQ